MTTQDITAPTSHWLISLLDITPSLTPGEAVIYANLVNEWHYSRHYRILKEEHTALLTLIASHLLPGGGTLDEETALLVLDLARYGVAVRKAANEHNSARASVFSSARLARRLGITDDEIALLTGFPLDDILAH